MTKKDALQIGYDFCTVSNIATAVSLANEVGYSKYYVPIAHPRFKREFCDEDIIKSNGDDFSRSLVAVYPQDCINYIVGKLSDYVDVDSENVKLRKFSECTVDQEIRWCIYLGISNILITLPVNGSFVNLARIIYSKFKATHSSPTFLVKVSMISPKSSAASYVGDEVSINDSWERWNSFRTFCGSEKKLRVALEISENLPDEKEIARWLGEPLACVFINTKTFLTNHKGYPVLSKAHQDLVISVMKRHVHVVISGSAREDTLLYYQQYINFLWQKVDFSSENTSFTHGYEDFLQIPLQPLMDNLDRYTYEVFEQDPVKYREYQRAMKLALIDKKAVKEESYQFIIMVVGAGRGPIVNAALNAAKEANANVHVYAVEKNPFAVVSLQTQKLDRWKDSVTIIASDMRAWNSTVKADIIVSELLGSFGDNELSPECLDGVQHLLKDDGISIPSSYNSYICPTQTHKIYSEILDFVDREKPPHHRFELPYVVHLQTIYHLAPIQKLFTFVHPNHETPIDNTRFKKSVFEIDQDSVLHGFSGFFDTVLYKDVILSIVPETYSEGMFSWFPIFFPIKEPVQLRKGDKVEVSFWRLHNDKIVWYEWLVSAPVSLPVHNPNGRSYFIGLT
ncbi:protein arginine N-methyltransferase 5 [Planococcus citri]|uniref:protein arginine N-methyltransferase 5 n=1 Tax=Planococcus citri TaxID=170843 RepID=UPI0031F83B0A